MNHEKGWVQMLHLGALRNNNTRLFNKLGSDSGFDSIGDFNVAKALSKFLDTLDMEDKLAKTVLFNLNPKDNAVMASMIGNFQDGSIPGKMQFGPAWWFLDTKKGMLDQMDVLSNMGMLSQFIGMETDSRSFLSYPRHEYFRRILCNMLGEEIQKGELPNDLELIGKIVKDICYNNAKKYFDIEL
jgi:glucuronate isomerase